MRGVHGDKAGIGDRRPGSSPHARGPRSILDRFLVRYRIIPACAGSTKRAPRRLPWVQDHPRMRGVHQNAQSNLNVNLGSSPHARGPQDSRASPADYIGIIPACAGSTQERKGNENTTQDHPRMRGVHPAAVRPGLRQRGSSPHARGPPSNAELDYMQRRIIPACAGSTDPEHQPQG